MTAEGEGGGTSAGETTPADPPSSAPASAPASARVPPASERRLGVEEITFIALLVVSIGGVAVADFSARSGLTYWLVVIPIFGAVSIHSAWLRSRARGENVGAVLLRQLLHWGALVPAVYLIYLLEQPGRLNREDAGLVALLSLSLATVLAGVHFDWRLAVLGILLAIGTACAALVEEFFWILLIPAVAAGAGVILWQRRRS